jgi:Holliday junction resolvasome RuvABC ATP-dependent DNA helicase subunit
MNQVNIEIIKANIQAQLQSLYVAPIVLASSPGIGKTSAIKSIAKEIGCDIVTTSAPSLSAEMLSGIPDFISDTTMDKYSVIDTTNSKATQWSVPEILYTANNILIRIK